MTDIIEERRKNNKNLKDHLIVQNPKMTNMLLNFTVLIGNKDMYRMKRNLQPTQKKTNRKGFSNTSGNIHFKSSVYNFLIHSIKEYTECETTIETSNLRSLNFGLRKSNHYKKRINLQTKKTDKTHVIVANNETKTKSKDQISDQHASSVVSEKLKIRTRLHAPVIGKKGNCGKSPKTVKNANKNMIMNITCPGSSDFFNPSVKINRVKEIIKYYNAKMENISCDNILITFHVLGLNQLHIDLLITHQDFKVPDLMSQSINFGINFSGKHLKIIIFYTQYPVKINITGIKNYENIDEIINKCIHHIENAIRTSTSE